MMRIAAFTGGRTISSSRFRVRQYIPELRRHDIEMTEFTAPLSAWPPRNQLVRPAWAIASLASRLPAIATSYGFDLTFLQREMLSTFRTLEPLTRRPRVLDLDDAVWLSRESQIRKLVEDMDGVVCGNGFIDEWVSRWNPTRHIVPTAVDTDRFVPARSPCDDTLPQRRIIGWSGLHAGAKYLLSIEGALAAVMDAHPDVILRVVSDRRPDFRQVPDDRIEFIRWTPQNEVRTIQEMTIGVMPLLDTPWERGKCSYKMLLYMACAVAVVVSPVGMNRDVLASGQPGLAATTIDDWSEALDALLKDPATATRMGVEGRQIVVRDYSLPSVAANLASFLHGFAS